MEKRRIGDANFVSINFPGNVINSNNAMVMLGGFDKIVDYISNPTEKNLELKFRPNDILSHGIVGNLEPCNKLLLNIKVKNKKIVKSQIVGKITQEIKFDSLCDFQSVEKSVANSNISVSSSNTQSTAEEQERELNIPPPIFSTFSRLFEYNFEENRATQIVTTKRGPDGEETVRKKLKKVIGPIFQMIVDQNIEKVPDKILEGKERSDFDNQELFYFFKKIFKARAMWSMLAIRTLNRKKFGKELNHSSKTMLPQFSYKFKSGPFKSIHIKYGIDPRKESRYGLYQIVSFRVPRDLRETLQEKENKIQNFMFIGPPEKFQQHLQLCDIRIKSVIEFLKNSETKESLDNKNGWYSKSILNEVLMKMKKKLLYWLKNDGSHVNDPDVIIPKGELYELAISEVPKKKKEKKRKAKKDDDGDVDMDDDKWKKKRKKKRKKKKKDKEKKKKKKKKKEKKEKEKEKEKEKDDLKSKEITEIIIVDDDEDDKPL